MDLTLTQDGLRAIETLLHDSIDSEVELLNDASRHILSSGGKHLRPDVALLAYLAAGGDDLNGAGGMAAGQGNETGSCTTGVGTAEAA